MKSTFVSMVCLGMLVAGNAMAACSEAQSARFVEINRRSYDAMKTSVTTTKNMYSPTGTLAGIHQAADNATKSGNKVGELLRNWAPSQTVEGEVNRMKGFVAERNRLLDQFYNQASVQWNTYVSAYKECLSAVDQLKACNYAATTAKCAEYVLPDAPKELAGYAGAVRH